MNYFEVVINYIYFTEITYISDMLKNRYDKIAYTQIPFAIADLHAFIIMSRTIE